MKYFGMGDDAAAQAESDAARDEILGKMGITMSHDELVDLIGADNHAKIVAAGFILMPKNLWKEQFSRCPSPG